MYTGFWPGTVTFYFYCFVSDVCICRMFFNVLKICFILALLLVTAYVFYVLIVYFHYFYYFISVLLL